MSRIEVAPKVREDDCGIPEHLKKFEVKEPSARIDDIVQGISVLERNPLIGRLVRNDLRELTIGRDAHGYVAIHQYVPEVDTVFLLAIRNQREAGSRKL